MPVKKFNYQKISKEYEDSLSQFDFNKVFNNPDHGALNFLDIREEFEIFFKMLYELEVLNYRNNIHQQEVNKVDGIRNHFIAYFNKINQFDIKQQNASQIREDIFNQVRSYIESRSKDLDDILIKIKTKNFFASSKGDVAYKEVQEQRKKIEDETEKIVSIREELESAKKSYEKEIKHIQSLKIPKTEKRVGVVNISKFFLEQSEKHNFNAEDKNNGWLKNRKMFLNLIYWLLGISVGAYLVSFLVVVSIDSLQILDWEKFWNLRAGVLIFSLLSVFYAGLYFATKNYSKEKNLEYQNINRSNIANTIGLISADEEDRIREIIFTEATRTIFSDINQEQQSKNEKGQNVQISLPTSGVPKIIDDNLNK
jgi:hypothetical protein